MTVKIDEIRHSKRKSIALAITPEARLIVRAPFGVSLQYIESVVNKQRSWIERKRAGVLSAGIPQPKQFIDGEKFLFLGREYLLKIQDHGEIRLTENCLLFPKRFLAKAKLHLIDWYKEQMFALVTEISQYYSNLTGWQYKTINITSAQSRWGSCSSSGSINFSWKLILAPREVVEYVVVHELAHIKQKNHSSRFWNEVRKILPHYQVQEKWLKANGRWLLNSTRFNSSASES